MVASIVSQQLPPQNDNKLALGLASYLAKGENPNNSLGNVAKIQSQTGLFGNQTSTPSFYNQNNPQISNIALANQTPQNHQQNYGTANSYNQPPLSSLFGSQVNNSVLCTNFTGNNFTNPQNSLPTFQSPFNPSINEHQDHQYNQAWTNQVQTQHFDLNHFPQYQPSTQQAQYLSAFGYIPELNIHLTP